MPTSTVYSFMKLRTIKPAPASSTMVSASCATTMVLLNQRTLYVAETETARLWAFELTAPGEIRRLPWPSPHGGRLVTGSATYRRFDSLAVDRAGNICVATLVDGGILIVSPDGARARHVPMPERWPTNICFGGPDLRTAYITLSSTGRLVACRWEEAGTPLAYLNA